MKKEFMKRVMAAGMVAAMALTTVACGGSADNSASTDKAEAPAEDAAPATEAAAAEDDGSYDECTLTISWWGGDSRHTATQAAVDAFMKAYPESQLKQPIPHGMDGKRKWQLLLQQEPHRM